MTDTHLSADIIANSINEEKKYDLQEPNYTYRVHRIPAEVSEKHESPHIVDGDTVDVTIDLGFYTSVRKRIRLLDLDTDEIRGGTEETKQRAHAAKLRIEDLLSEGDIYIKTEMDATGKYGRVLGWLYVVLEDGSVINVNKTLRDEGFEKGDATTSTVADWIKKLNPFT